jgi:acetyl-CoA carboxylase biotin carboxylase subunit
MDASLRRAMGEAAVQLARGGGYTNAGTVEFLVDAQRNFYFLEMNTRLQVEHPVTEMVTSLDLVKLQIRIAAGEPLPLAQPDVSLRGHAIECRIYAEDPDNGFFPSPGKILERRLPGGPGIRCDDGVYAGWTVPTDYDPLLGKVIAWGGDRAEAVARMHRALGEYYATGIKANAGFFRRIFAEPEFLRGEFHTRWLDDLLQRPTKEAGLMENEAAGNGASAEDVATLAAALSHMRKENLASQSVAAGPPESAARWKLEGRREQLDRASLARGKRR